MKSGRHALAGLKPAKGQVSGAEAADMYQTHGFPPEVFETLTKEWATPRAMRAPRPREAMRDGIREKG